MWQSGLISLLRLFSVENGEERKAGEEQNTTKVKELAEVKVCAGRKEAAL